MSAVPKQFLTPQEYVLISQDRLLVEHYVRQGQDEWLLTEQSSLQETLALPSIQCRLPLSEIYLKVRLSPEAGEAQMTNDEGQSE